MTRIAPSFKAQRTAQALLWLLLVGFAWLQLAGTLHTYLHQSRTNTQESQSFEALYPAHSQQNKTDCQLLDLQCTGLALSLTSPVMAMPVFALQATAYRAVSFICSPSPVYQARAPPALSI